jgi:hypothetical protein
MPRRASAKRRPTEKSIIEATGAFLEDIVVKPIMMPINAVQSVLSQGQGQNGDGETAHVAGPPTSATRCGASTSAEEGGEDDPEEALLGKVDACTQTKVGSSDQANKGLPLGNGRDVLATWDMEAHIRDQPLPVGLTRGKDTDKCKAAAALALRKSAVKIVELDSLPPSKRKGKEVIHIPQDVQPGLKWANRGPTRPSEALLPLANEELASALSTGRVDFSPAELDEFDLPHGLSTEHFILVGSSHWMPDVTVAYAIIRTPYLPTFESAAERDMRRAQEAADASITGLPPPTSYLPRLSKLNQFGLSLAVNLYLRFLVEAAITLFLMALLSIGTMYDNVTRADARAACRRGLTTPETYAVLTNASAITKGMARRAERLVGFAPELCGWAGMSIRKLFVGNETDYTSDSLANYQPNNIFMLRTATGACDEFFERPCGPSCNAELIQADPFGLLQSEYPGTIVVNTRKAIYCTQGVESGKYDFAAAWCQLLATVVFFAFLVRLRWLSQKLAKQEDRSMITTSDFSLQFVNLKTGTAPDDPVYDLVPHARGRQWTADDLREAFSFEMERVMEESGKKFLAPPGERIKHVEVGRFCQKEIAVMCKMSALDLEATELYERFLLKQEYRVKCDSEMAKLGEGEKGLAERCERAAPRTPTRGSPAASPAAAHTQPRG